VIDSLFAINKPPGLFTVISVGFSKNPAAGLIEASTRPLPKTGERWFSVPTLPRPIDMPVDTYAGWHI
jgi:hypothetical protein